MVGRACGLPEGQARPGTYCEPKMTTVGSQDTTGPMTRDELKDLACLGFSADWSCSRSATPRPIRSRSTSTPTHLPDFIMTRGGVSLRPGDGIIHSWLNRMLLPDTVGTGGDSHTRFPIGISFPAVLAWSPSPPPLASCRWTCRSRYWCASRVRCSLASPCATWFMRFPTTPSARPADRREEGKKNIFSGRILEIEGLNQLTVEQAFELSDASAERSAAGCTIKLPEESIAEYLKSNITMLRWMISEGYGDADSRVALGDGSLAGQPAAAGSRQGRRIRGRDRDRPVRSERARACAPNDPDDARLLSTVAGEKIDEVFIGSCMTNIGHFRAAGKLLDKVKGGIPTRLWLARRPRWTLTS